MKTLFRHKKNKLLYTLEKVLMSKLLDGGGSIGIYPKPYNHSVNLDNHTRVDCALKNIPYNPDKFVSENFDIVADFNYKN